MGGVTLGHTNTQALHQVTFLAVQKMLPGGNRQYSLSNLDEWGQKVYKAYKFIAPPSNLLPRFA
jgi:hypothetical protein